MNPQCAFRSHVGLKRRLNEDAVLALPQQSFFAVADGMGGHDCGEIASARIVDALRKAAMSALPRSAMLHRLKIALEETHISLVKMGAELGDGRTIGSTVAALRLDRGVFDFFWAGDSRIYGWEGSHWSLLTEDHTLVQRLVRGGLLSEADAERHPDSHVLTRAIGSAGAGEVEFGCGDISPGDLFLLATDGLTKSVDSQALALATDPDDLEATAERLLNLALAAGGPDNITFVLVKAC